MHFMSYSRLHVLQQAWLTLEKTQFTVYELKIVIYDSTFCSIKFECKKP